MATTGLATTGVATTGVATTGLETTGTIHREGEFYDTQKGRDVYLGERRDLKPPEHLGAEVPITGSGISTGLGTTGGLGYGEGYH